MTSKEIWTERIYMFVFVLVLTTLVIGVALLGRFFTNDRLERRSESADTMQTICENHGGTFVRSIYYDYYDNRDTRRSAGADWCIGD